VIRSFLSRRSVIIGASSTLALAASPLFAKSPGLAELRRRIETGEIPDVHSVLVVHHGRTLAEWYFRGMDEMRGGGDRIVTFGVDALHDMRSVTKSFVSLLFGIAMNEGRIGNLDKPVLDYFPEYRDLATLERRRVTLRHLLTMTSGLRWDEGPSYKDPRNSETAMDLAPDRYRYILSQPFDSAPGERWRYSGGDVALIAAVVARTTDKPLDQYGREKLFAPLGISEFAWLKDSHGVPIAASGLRLKPRDMVKIGLMVLHGGRDAAGSQLVSQQWISESTMAHAKAFPAGNCAVEYGYFWWLGPSCAPRWISAIGNGGQRIYLVPEEDLVIVTTAGLYNSPKQNQINDVLTAVHDAVR
jgi:CubicO group peptidase (beta-lactamase class C family)